MIDTLRPAPLQTLTRDTAIVEIARLVNKAHLLIHVLGGLLPALKPESMQHITSVLDVACGPGIWALELARRQPKISVIGIDTSDVVFRSNKQWTTLRILQFPVSLNHSLSRGPLLTS